MSQVKISGDPSGTGIFTISAPNSNTNRALVLPNSAGTMATAESTLAQFNASGSAPVYAARAWVNFNGTGTVAIRASGNVSSITDNGVGDYTVNFTAAMPDANYAAEITGSRDNTTSRFGDSFINYGPSTTTTQRILTNNTAGTAVDWVILNVAIFR